MMPTEAPEVAEFLQELEHPMKDGILKLRDAILASDDQITDHIKWNAPSFCYHGDDRVTFRLQPGDRLQLIFIVEPGFAMTAPTSYSRMPPGSSSGLLRTGAR